MHTPTCTPTAQIVVHEAKDAASLARNIPSEGLSTSAVPSTLKPAGAGLARCRPLRVGDLYMWVCVHHSMRAMMRIPVFFVSMRFQRNEQPPKTASGQTSPHTKRKQKGAHVHPLTCTHARPYGYTYIHIYGYTVRLGTATRTKGGGGGTKTVTPPPPVTAAKQYEVKDGCGRGMWPRSSAYGKLFARACFFFFVVPAHYCVRRRAALQWEMDGRIIEEGGKPHGGTT